MAREDILLRMGRGCMIVLSVCHGLHLHLLLMWGHHIHLPVGAHHGLWLWLPIHIPHIRIPRRAASNSTIRVG